LSDLLVFGRRAGVYAAKFAKDNPGGSLDEAEVNGVAKLALLPFEGSPDAEGPYKVQEDLQEMMQRLVGIVRREDELSTALSEIETLRHRSGRVAVHGNREYNPGWHTALDLDNLLTVSEAIARCALERKESRGGHFRDDFPDKDKAFSEFNHVVKRGLDGKMELRREPIKPMTAELQQIIEENK
ncbi:MAG TPA: hypothetical protein VNW92_31260, partial [Polyangiaceae bacterium]|nr:hypothetical protein [Polyangiaceae bacterium]